jgi:hypothetical protein
MDRGDHLSVFRFSSEECQMAEVATIEMQDRELFAAMAMQALITREGAPADLIAKQAVAYADALIEALTGIGPPESHQSGTETPGAEPGSTK